MKKCNYCKSERPDDLEFCCGLSDFTPVIDEFEEEFIDKNVEDPEEVEIHPQPAAHELLVELVELIDIDGIVEEYETPEWIQAIPYDDVREDAIARYELEHPGVVARVKKYLGL